MTGRIVAFAVVALASLAGAMTATAFLAVTLVRPLVLGRPLFARLPPLGDADALRDRLVILAAWGGAVVLLWVLARAVATAGDVLFGWGRRGAREAIAAVERRGAAVADAARTPPPTRP